MQALGLDHVDLSVGDLERSTGYYGLVLGALGFSRVQHPSYVAFSNGRMNVGLRPAPPEHRAAGHERLRPGLHHLALRALARRDVDDLHDFLLEHELPVLDAPAEYPQYGPDYYAVFFADPDGLKLELVHFPWGYWRRVQEGGGDPRPRWPTRRS